LLQHEMGDDATSAQHLQKARELGEQTRLVDWPYRWHLAQAQLKESGGELESTLILLDEARRVYVKNPVPDTRPIDALKAKVYLKQGRLSKAQDWVRERGLTTEDEISYLGEFEHITLARVLIAEYQSNQSEHSSLQAIGLLERLLKAAETQKRMGSVLEILVAEALAHQAQGNLPLALASLERALILAHPEGYFRIFVDEGDSMRLLILEFWSRIEKQLSSQDHPLLGYVEKLISAFARPVEKQATISNVKSEMIEPLSSRELEILQLIAQGLSNPEIGRRLFLAVDTIKGHNRRIFDKLQVQRRTEAVARAHELGLI
jgi:LuxR family maltose regulon positive regulatory protein